MRKKMTKVKNIRNYRKKKVKKMVQNQRVVIQSSAPSGGTQVSNQVDALRRNQEQSLNNLLQQQREQNGMVLGKLEQIRREQQVASNDWQSRFGGGGDTSSVVSDSSEAMRR